MAATSSFESLNAASYPYFSDENLEYLKDPRSILDNKETLVLKSAVYPLAANAPFSSLSLQALPGHKEINDFMNKTWSCHVGQSDTADNENGRNELTNRNFKGPYFSHNATLYESVQPSMMNSQKSDRFQCGGGQAIGSIDRQPQLPECQSSLIPSHQSREGVSRAKKCSLDWSRMSPVLEKEAMPWAKIENDDDGHSFENDRSKSFQLFDKIGGAQPPKPHVIKQKNELSYRYSDSVRGRHTTGPLDMAIFCEHANRQLDRDSSSFYEGKSWELSNTVGTVKKVLDAPHRTNKDQFWLQLPDLPVPLSIFVGNIPKDITLEVFRRTMHLKGNVTDIFGEFRPGCWSTAHVTYSNCSEAVRAIEFFNNKKAFKNSYYHRLVCCFAPPPPASLCCSGQSSGSAREFRASLIQSTTKCPTIFPFFPKFELEAQENMGSHKPPSSPRFSLLKDGPAGANLFVYGIPSDWTEVTLMRLCQEFGHIVGIRVPGAPTSGSQRLNKGFGFVSYDSTESSSRALEALSGRQFLGKPLNIQLKLGEQLASNPYQNVKDNKFLNLESSAIDNISTSRTSVFKLSDCPTLRKFRKDVAKMRSVYESRCYDAKCEDGVHERRKSTHGVIFHQSVNSAGDDGIILNRDLKCGAERLAVETPLRSSRSLKSNISSPSSLNYKSIEKLAERESRNRFFTLGSIVNQTRKENQQSDFALSSTVSSEEQNAGETEDSISDDEKNQSSFLLTPSNRASSFKRLCSSTSHKVEFKESQQPSDSRESKMEKAETVNSTVMCSLFGSKGEESINQIKGESWSASLDNVNPLEELLPAVASTDQTSFKGDHISSEKNQQLLNDQADATLTWECLKDMIAQWHQATTQTKSLDQDDGKKEYDHQIVDHDFFSELKRPASLFCTPIEHHLNLA